MLQPFRFGRLATALLFLCVLGGAVMAAPGKISGVVIDKNSGEPLPGANIIVEGENTGAATDTDGFFFILNLRPGEYTIRAEMVGYGTLIKQNVKVTVNQTTQVRFEMLEEAVQGEAVVVEAERPVVQLDVSNSQRVVTEEELQERPLENLEEILATEVGITATAGTGGDASTVL